MRPSDGNTTDSRFGLDFATRCAGGCARPAAPVTLSATAAVDTTPPKWKKPVTASIPVGAKLSAPSNPLWCDSTPTGEYELPVVLDYRAVDPESGIDDYVISGTFDYEETTATRTRYLARTYTGQWGISNCACWSDGTTHRTTREGASVAYRVSSAVISSTGHHIDNARYALA